MAHYCGLKLAAARVIVAQVQATVAQWRNSAAAHGLSAQMMWRAWPQHLSIARQFYRQRQSTAARNNTWLELGAHKNYFVGTVIFRAACANHALSGDDAEAGARKCRILFKPNPPNACIV